MYDGVHISQQLDRLCGTEKDSALILGSIMSNLELKIQRPERLLRDQVTETLRNAVIRGVFSPGDRLTERELVDLTGVSRTSLREGLRQLQAEGLLEQAAGRGLQVTLFSPAAVAELYEVREHLESAAVELFVARATDAELADLVHSVGAEDSAPSDLGALSSFHRALLDGAHNSLLKSLYESIAAKLAMMQNLSIRVPGRAAQSRAELQSVLEYMQRRDSEGAREAVRSHVRKAQEVALQELAAAAEH